MFMPCSLLLKLHCTQVALWAVIGTAHIACGAGFCVTVQCLSICLCIRLSVQAWAHSSKPAASQQQSRSCRFAAVGTGCSVLFFSRPRSKGWQHHGRTFSIYPCPLSFLLTLPRRVLSTSWCCPSRPCLAFLACVHVPGIVPCIISFSRQLTCFLMVWP